MSNQLNKASFCSTLRIVLVWLKIWSYVTRVTRSVVVYTGRTETVNNHCHNTLDMPRKALSGAIMPWLNVRDASSICCLRLIYISISVENLRDNPCYKCFIIIAKFPSKIKYSYSLIAKSMSCFISMGEWTRFGKTR